MSTISIRLCAIFFFCMMFLSCGAQPTPSLDTAALNECNIEPKEIELLNALFDAFDQKMQASYSCKNRDESIRYLILNFDGLQKEGKLFEMTPEEERLIEAYNQCPTFTNYRLNKKSLYEGEPHMAEIFLRATYQAYGECLAKRSKFMKELEAWLPMAVEITTHMMAYYFRDEIKTTSPIGAATAMGIFINVYLYELVDTQYIPEEPDVY